MKRIGEILIENGSITSSQLQDALDRQKKGTPKKLIGKILIELGYITEEDIVVALSSQSNVPYLSLGSFSFTEVKEWLIPRELVEKYVCVPLEKIGNLLTVVMSDPTNDEAITAIETATKCKVQIFVATDTEILTVLKQYFHIDLRPRDAAFVSASTKNETKTVR